jgi:hypothetical protein
MLVRAFSAAFSNEVRKVRGTDHGLLKEARTYRSAISANVGRMMLSQTRLASGAIVEPPGMLPHARGLRSIREPLCHNLSLRD